MKHRTGMVVQTAVGGGPPHSPEKRGNAVFFRPLLADARMLPLVLSLALLVLLALLALLGGCAAPLMPEPGHRKFIQDFPKWERIRDLERENPSFSGTGPVMPDAIRAATWERLRATLPKAGIRQKLEAINAFFNQWPYTNDMALWAVEDYWALPREFVLWSGDCEDYAIAKYYALRFLGVPARDMRIAGVFNRRRGEGHAVLLVYVEDETLLLDNFADAILTREQAPHYEPVYYVNEDWMWIQETPR